MFDAHAVGFKCRVKVVQLVGLLVHLWAVTCDTWRLRWTRWIHLHCDICG